jgi:3-deoxy-D-manno-octulosonic-acid transferase
VIWFYRIAFPFVALLLAPYYLSRMLKRGGYARKLSYRIGLWPKLPPKRKGISRIWIQAVSVGELSSIGKLLDELLSNPQLEVVLSGTTSTGLSIAEEKYAGRLLAQGPFPLDWLPFSALAWSRIQPDLTLAVDSELWPEHMKQAAKRGIPFLILNARLSDRSYRRLQFFRIFHGILIPENMNVLASSEKQHERWMDLGLAPDQVTVTGNLKVDVVSKGRPDPEDKRKLLEEFGFGKKCIVLAGISTWPGEEKILLDSIKELREEGIDIRLLIIPRHAERREEIRKTLTSASLSFSLRTEEAKAPEGAIVYLADTTGELPELIKVADFAFLGKTIPPNSGGQNPIEPVSIGLPLVIGPAYQNFRETCAELFSHGVAFKAGEKKDVEDLIGEFAQNEDKRNHAREACFSWIQMQGSPTKTTLKLLNGFLAKEKST